MNKLQNINTLTLFLTNRCNLQCKYCWEDKKSNEMMSVSDVKMIIDEYLNNNVSSRVLCLYGGEPTLNIEALDYISNLYNLGNTAIKMTTNLVDLSDELLDILERLYHKNDFELTVSLDIFKSINDKNRGIIYDKVMRNIDRLQSRGIKFLINSVITNDLLSYIKDHNLSDISFDYINVTTFNLLSPSNKMDSAYNEDLLDYIFDLYYFKGGLKNDVVKNVAETLFGRFLEPQKYAKLCSAGTSDICILPNMNVLSCVKEYNIGCSIPYSDFDINSCEKYRNSIGNPKDYISEFTHDKCNECPISDSCIICEALNYEWTHDKKMVPAWQCRDMLTLYKVWSKHYEKYLNLLYYYIDDEISSQTDISINICEKFLGKDAK